MSPVRICLVRGKKKTGVFVGNQTRSRRFSDGPSLMVIELERTQATGVI
jgi:hypothetical protein